MAVGELSWTLFYADVLTEPEAATFPRIEEAGRLLAAGQVAEAEAVLARVPPGGTEAGLRDALQAIIAVGRKDAAAAMRLAERAVAEAPGSAVPQLALSYARQLATDLDGAFAAAEEAAGLAPREPLPRARLAEIHLMRGETRAARRAANEAVELGAGSLAQIVLGYAELAALRGSRAETAFRRALPFRSWSCEPACEQACVVEVEHGVAAGDQGLDVLGQPPVAAEPGEAAFDDPAPGQEDEAVSMVGALDDGQLDPLLTRGRGCDLTLVAAVGEQQAEEGEARRMRVSTSASPSRSWTLAAWTMPRSRKPSVSTSTCRLRPLIFLPASKPRGRRFRSSSPTGCRRSPRSAAARDRPPAVPAPAGRSTGRAGCRPATSAGNSRRPCS